MPFVSSGRNNIPSAFYEDSEHEQRKEDNVLWTI